jgi:hypothetical protein
MRKTGFLYPSVDGFYLSWRLLSRHLTRIHMRTELDPNFGTIGNELRKSA